MRHGESVSSTAETLEKEVVAAAESAPSAATRHAPVTIIERRPNWKIVDFRELWRYRELLFLLTWRDVKVRYKQTVLGALWAILQPFATMVVFTLFFRQLGQMPTEGVDYSLYVFAGLLAWTFVANAVSNASNSIVASQNLVTKVYFPRLMIPMGAVGASLVDFVIGFSMLVLLMLVDPKGVHPGWTVLLIPLFMLGLGIVALGVGITLSALTVAYRDFRHVVPFMVQLWMFATPTIYMYTDTLANPRWRLVLPLNPAYGLIANFRRAVFGGPLDGYELGVSLGVACTLLVAACLYFRRVERSFADII
ncbi:MAG: ABC transporter permease [Planctomycetes bacterium]|nr:ABC transporter permease [Planctomycetota bacterium]